LASFLARVAEFSDINKMNKANLGIVFGPNLVRQKMQMLHNNLQMVL